MRGSLPSLALYVSHRVNRQSRFGDSLLQPLNGVIKVSLEQGAVCVLEFALCHHHGVRVVD